LDTAAPDTAAAGDIVIQTPNDGNFMEGETITFAADFGEAVMVSGGTPNLTLSNGASASLDMLNSDLSTGALVFTYDVASGDTNTADLQVTGLNGTGVIADLAGNAAVVNTTTDLAIIIDTIDPVLDADGPDVTSTNFAEYAEGATPAAPATNMGDSIATFPGTDGGTASELTYAITAVTGTAMADLSTAVVLVDEGGSWNLRVVDPEAFDHEDHPTIVVSIDIIDAAGNATNADFTINVTNEDDAPTIISADDTGIIGERADTNDAAENTPVEFGERGDIIFQFRGRPLQRRKWRLSTPLATVSSSLRSLKWPLQMTTQPTLATRIWR